MTGPHVLYDELASWWPLLSSPDDYEEEAGFYTAALKEHAEGPAATLLELGSGGGNNASYMKAAFDELTLVDLSPGMLDVSRALNPECAHHEGDMRSVRLGRTFDCVFVHDAIVYATTLDDLRAVADTAAVHCRPGGALLMAPDYVRETFRPGTEHGGDDGDGRALRYMEWTWDPDPSDTTYVADYTFVTRVGDDPPHVHLDRHVEGLFATGDWLGVLTGAGFEPRTLTFDHEHGPVGHVVFAGVRRA